MATHAQLNEARAAYHSLLTGQSVRVFVDQNGERVEMLAPTPAKLLSYITQLELALGVNAPAANRPARFLF